MEVDKAALQKYIEKSTLEQAKPVALEAQEKLIKFYEGQMTQYYNDFKPKWYHRSFNLKNRSYLPYYHNNGKEIYGGILISSDDMVERYNDPASTILYYAYEKGRHGEFGPPTGFNIQENMHTYRDTLCAELSKKYGVK